METIRNLNQIAGFVAVARKLSFSEAAREMGVSKAYLSKLVNALEEEIGVQLLLRTTRQVKLTQEGARFFEKSEEGLARLREAQHAIAKQTEEPVGLLRVSLAGAFGEDYIAPLALKLMKKFPKLSLELSFSERLVDLEKEGVDVAIRVGGLPDHKLKAIKISSRREYLCATRPYLEHYGYPKTPDDLREHSCLIGTSEQWRFQNDKTQWSLKVQGRLKTNNGRALLRATLDGLGISRLPGVYVKELIDQGKLVALLDHYLPDEVPIWAITSEELQDHPRVVHFLKELEKGGSL